jgi:hypothetical protein
MPRKHSVDGLKYSTGVSCLIRLLIAYFHLKNVLLFPCSDTANIFQTASLLVFEINKTPKCEQDGEAVVLDVRLNIHTMDISILDLVSLDLMEVYSTMIG